MPVNSEGQGEKAVVGCPYCLGGQALPCSRAGALGKQEQLAQDPCRSCSSK